MYCYKQRIGDLRKGGNKLQDLEECKKYNIVHKRKKFIAIAIYLC